MTDLDFFLLWLKENDELSGWAQAAGGILAVAAAFLIARGDRRAEGRRHKYRQTALEGAVLTAASEVLGIVRSQLSILLDNEGQKNVAAHGLPLEELNDGMILVDSFPITDLDDSAVGFHLRWLRIVARGARRYMETCVELLEGGGTVSDSERKDIADLLARFDEIEAGLVSAINGARENRDQSEFRWSKLLSARPFAKH